MVFKRGEPKAALTYFILILIAVALIFSVLLVVNKDDGSYDNKNVEEVMDDRLKNDVLDKPLPLEEQLQLLDCGKDLKCFEEASLSCRPASVRRTFELNAFGTQTSTVYYELDSVNDKCSFYILTEEIEVSYDDVVVAFLTEQGYSLDEINQLESNANSLADEAEGLEGSCLFVPSDLSEMISRWRAGVVLSSDLEAADCSGAYFSPLP